MAPATAGRPGATVRAIATYRPQLLSRTVGRPRRALAHATAWRCWSGWAALTLSVAIYVAVSLAMHQPFHAGGLKLRDFDLRIYRLGALRLVHGAPLYGTPMIDGLGFTYPPFAAVLMAPLAAVRLSIDALAVSGLNVALLVWTLRRTLMLTAVPGSRTPVRASPLRGWSLAAGLAAAALWLEPVSVTLGYGQVNLLIAGLVVFDLARGDDARTKGIAVGVAAAIKLTPLLFIPYLALSRRGLAAGVAAATFVATVAVGFAAAPAAALSYWGGAVLDTSRVGNVAAPINQSLTGAIARLLATRHPSSAWELLVGGLALGGVALAARASRHGDEAAGVSLAAITALLASPISWPHHWTLAVPGLVLLAHRARERRSGALLASAVVLGAVGFAYLPEVAESHFQSTHGLVSLLVTDPYPVAGVLVLAVCGARLLGVAGEPRRAGRRTVARDGRGAGLESVVGSHKAPGPGPVSSGRPLVRCAGAVVSPHESEPPPTRGEETSEWAARRFSARREASAPPSPGGWHGGHR